MMLEGLQLMLENFWMVPAGVLLGMFIGAMPGLTSSGTLAMLLPMLMILPAESALMLGVCIYAGAEMGNSFPSVMLNIPGTPGGAVTCFDGYPMMLRGEAARALGICIMASTIGALTGGIAAITLTPMIAEMALHFGPVEICIVVLFGLAIFARLSSAGMARGLLAGFFGLLLATTGTDPTYGQSRGTFNIVYLFDHLPEVAALIGLLGFSEVLIHAERHISRVIASAGADATARVGWRGILQGFGDTTRRPLQSIRASVIGIGIGSMPGAGASIATVVAYQQAHALATPERKQEFGKGAHEGLIAADAANNAVVGGALVSLLVLGIPGSGSMAVLLVVMTYHGLAVGPTLFTFSGEIAYALLWSLCIAAGFVLTIGTVLAWGAWRIARVRLGYAVPVITVFCLLGAFARNGYVFDMGVMVAFGVLGYIMKKYRYPVVAMVLGIILGPLFEENFMRSWRMGFGELDIFWNSGTALLLWSILALTFAGPPVVRHLRRFFDRGDPGRNKP